MNYISILYLGTALGDTSSAEDPLLDAPMNRCKEIRTANFTSIDKIKPSDGIELLLQTAHSKDASPVQYCLLKVIWMPKRRAEEVDFGNFFNEDPAHERSPYL